MTDRKEQEIMQNWTKVDVPLVSVSCATYNHEKYIGDALDSFLMQETDFPFEVVVHDDCSTDGTASVIREYERHYPNIIRPIYETENQFSKHDGSIGRIMLAHMRGKYIAVCEGDDYWCDKYKLAKQVEYIEKHPDCSLMLCNGYNLSMSNGIYSPINPYDKTGIISPSQIITEGKMMPPTASMLYRRTDRIDMPEFFCKAPVGDRPTRMYLATKGYAYYMSDIMCVYRAGVPGSYSNRVHDDAIYNKYILDGMNDFFDRYDSYTDGQYKSELEFIRSRELYIYYNTAGETRKARQTYYYKKHFGFLEKLRMTVSPYIPKGIKDAIKSIINKHRQQGMQ